MSYLYPEFQFSCMVDQRMIVELIVEFLYQHLETNRQLDNHFYSLPKIKNNMSCMWNEMPQHYDVKIF